MSWLFVVVALALLGVGLALRIWMRGEDNYARASRVAANAILTLAFAGGVYAIPAIRGALDWYYVVLFLIGVVAYFAASLLRRNPVVARPERFEKKPKDERKSLSKDELADYKTARATYRRELRQYRYAKVPWLIALVATIVAIIVLLSRGLTHAALSFDPSYSPIHWGVLIAVASVVAGSILMRWPLGVNRPWNTLPLAVAAVVILAMTAIPAIIAFQAAANVIYQAPAEEDETKKRQPSVEILSELDKTCSPEYAVPSKMEDGDRLVPNWEAIGKVAGPEEVVSAVNPDLLLEKIQQEIDNPNFAKKWEENSREEIGTAGDDFNQVDFDSFVTGVKDKTTVPDNLIVRYGNGLCPTPYAKAAHVTFYGW